jgi:3-hydroxyisobutyrate dehydrogenase-like beta-hydroxyacid dehydrogenase
VDLPSYKDLVRETNIILSIMVPGETVRAARKVAETLRESGRTTIYVDCNAFSPDTGREIDSIFREIGSKYIDVSIIGGQPRQERINKVLCIRSRRASIYDPRGLWLGGPSPHLRGRSRQGNQDALRSLN